MEQAGTERPFRRHVFYIPGYDPVPPRRYRELYRAEGAEQARISGYRLKMRPRPKGLPNFGWAVEAEMEGGRAQATVEILYWADIVQQSMNKSIPATYWTLLRTAWEYISTGALFRLMKLRIGPILAALYPIAMLLAQLALALVVVAAAWWVGAAWGAAWAGLAAGLALGAGLLWWFRRKDGSFFAYYLMHDYGYSARYRGANPPELEARMAEFRARIAETLARDDLDEVLVVGHSSGAHLAVSILADILRDEPPRAGGPALSLLTLGQVIPMVSFLPEARRLRADLAYLAADARLTWVDVSAPGDGATFALCDPVAVSGVAPPEGQRNPLVISAAFSHTLSEQKRKELGRRFFRLHFQYLCAFDRPGDYDYFRVTAGPQTLAARFAHRSHSPSRIARPVNRFTATA